MKLVDVVITDQKLTSQVHEIVGRINGRFGTLTAAPIHHLVCFFLPLMHPIMLGFENCFSKDNS